MAFEFLCPLPNRKFNTLLLMPNLEWIIFTEVKYVPSEIFSAYTVDLDTVHMEEKTVFMVFRAYNASKQNCHSRVLSNGQRGRTRK